MLELIMLIALRTSQDSLPELLLTEDDTEITSSVRVVIPEGTVIADVAGDGVLRITADDVRVVFAPGSVLSGAPADTPWNRLEGVGIRLEGAKNVCLEGVVVRGFKAGIHGTDCDGLKILGANVSDNFRQRLYSTPEVCDDGHDWLGPHRNDGNEWLVRYGAGIYVEDSDGLTIADCFARRVQNGLLLDRVNDSRIYDNDFSFLSGWGLGLWRSGENMISRNAFDFCIRGYSHGIYNRGQDSAGILLFEQCSGNTFIENSVTHGGDGIFGFAGSEALGETDGLPEDFDCTRRGNNDNVFQRNDLSYAAAHGLEITFSFGNRIEANRFVGNAICGIWGGYSQETSIVENLFEANGDAGYGLERGGVNIEHSKNNRIEANRFLRNRCGVHLWWDPDEHLAKRPWALANGVECGGNSILGNLFQEDETAVHLRDCSGVKVGGNEMTGVGTEIDADAGSEFEKVRPAGVACAGEEISPLGDKHPVGARSRLIGRENIILDEWGPWDHRSPLLRRVHGESSRHRFELHEFPSEVEVALEGDGARLERVAGKNGAPPVLIISTEREGFTPYRLVVGDRIVSGKLERIGWVVTAFAWKIDPREDLEGWRAEATKGVTAEIPALRLPFAGGGPAFTEEVKAAGLPADHFGTIATARISLAPGRWRVTTRSDDGVRVEVDGETVIENWTWHPPATDVGEFTVAENGAGSVEIRVEHFEIDGYATLELELEAL
jgi:nitrous oxidase accessory protein NosD